MAERRRKFVRRFLKVLAVLAAVVVIGISTVLGLLWGEHRSDLTLPAPTGPFAVARTSYDWVDQSRTDGFAPDPSQKRELVVWIWYPADPATGSGPADYMPTPWRTALANYQGPLNSTFLSRDPAVVHTHSIADARVATDQPTFPVVLLRSGVGALATEYTTFAEDLASHGYVVVGMDTPYSTSVMVMADGRVVTKTDMGNPGDADITAEEQNRRADALIPVWTADSRFVLDQLERLNDQDPSGRFTHRLNTKAVGAVGHSFGGATAAQFCHDDARCAAGIDLDGAPHGPVVHDGLHRPFLFLTADHGDKLGDVDRAIRADIQSIYGGLPQDGRFWMAVKGTGHFNFSDQSLIKDGTLSKLLGATGSIDQRRGLAVMAGCIQQFFDHYLKADPADFSATVSRLYPEARADG
ncbi:family membership [Solihabitans fulvus]|uniref:Family membership n=1 Tax=Solihabitans fulvus TaxID=1892852 RepID=A0A5B2WWA4_9PSEU|nr:family membership [Solihabitans fulvus]KAA2256001.1 family membership [Solihabitans fulvus]